ncbi:MAG TPA: hypothetical protein PKD96_02435, partial [Candidatus Absconditabacterales bacterium]|nr:hypothetical protein [Candidatus Absconditabacterales bacterium]
SSTTRLDLRPRSTAGRWRGYLDSAKLEFIPIEFIDISYRDHEHTESDQFSRKLVFVNKENIVFLIKNLSYCIEKLKKYSQLIDGFYLIEKDYEVHTYQEQISSLPNRFYYSGSGARGYEN